MLEKRRLTWTPSPEKGGGNWMDWLRITTKKPYCQVTAMSGADNKGLEDMAGTGLYRNWGWEEPDGHLRDLGQDWPSLPPRLLSDWKYTHTYPLDCWTHWKNEPKRDSLMLFCWFLLHFSSDLNGLLSKNDWESLEELCWEATEETLLAIKFNHFSGPTIL